MSDQFTDRINATNQQRWFSQASFNKIRLCLTLGISPTGEIIIYAAAEMPPGEMVKMLRMCADAMEKQSSTGSIIIPG